VENLKNEGLKLVNELRELTKEKHSFLTPTGTRIQDKEYYFNYLEKYFNGVKIEVKWIEILKEIKTSLENETNKL